MTSAPIELLNPSRNWQIGSLGQLYSLDISGDLHVSNKIIAKDISISGLFETATPVFSDISLTNYKDASL